MVALLAELSIFNNRDPVTINNSWQSMGDYNHSVLFWLY